MLPVILRHLKFFSSHYAYQIYVLIVFLIKLTNVSCNDVIIISSFYVICFLVKIKKIQIKYNDIFSVGTSN